MNCICIAAALCGVELDGEARVIVDGTKPLKDVEFTYKVVQYDTSDESKPPHRMYEFNGNLVYASKGCIRDVSIKDPGNPGCKQVERSYRVGQGCRTKTIGLNGQPTQQSWSRGDEKNVKDANHSITNMFVAPYLQLSSEKNRKQWKVAEKSPSSVEVEFTWLAKFQYKLDPTRQFVPVGLTTESSFENGRMDYKRHAKVAGADGVECWLPIEAVSDLKFKGGRGRLASVRYEFKIDESSIKLNRGLKAEDVEVQFDARIPVHDFGR